MVDLFAQRGITIGQQPASGGRDLFAERGISIGPSAKPADAAGITDFWSAGQAALGGFNRGLGTLAGGADYALLGFLDDTKEGQAKRPLGYLAQLLKGEQAVPGTDDERLAYEPVTTGQKLLGRGGEVVGESIAPMGAFSAAGRLAVQPAKTTAQAVAQQMVNAQKTAPYKTLGVESGTAFTSGVGEETGRQMAPDSALAPVVGGIAGGLAPGALSAPIARKVLGKGYQVARDALSPTAREARAKDFVTEHVGPRILDDLDNPQSGLKRADELEQQIAGFSPDLAQRTRSSALRATKDDITSRASGEDLDELKAREQANLEAIRAYAQRQVPQGDPAADAAFEPLLQDRRAAAEQVRLLEEQQKATAEAARERQARLLEQRTGIRQDTSAKAFELRSQAAALPKTSDVMARERQALLDLQERTTGARQEVANRLTRIDRPTAGGAIRDDILAERGRRVAALNAEAEQLGLEGLKLTTPFRNFAGNIKSWRDGLLPSQAENMPSVLKDIDQIMTKPTVTFSDVKALRESLVDDVLEAGRDPNPGARKRRKNAIQLREMLDQQVLGADVLEGWQPPEGLERAAHYVGNADFENILSRARAPKAKTKPFMTLTDFLVQKGGLSESGGELKARDIGNRSRPGLFRQQGKGMGHDEAADLAWQAGFFPGASERPAPDEMLRALQDDLAGRAQRREVDLDDAATLEAESAATDDFTAAMDELGIDWRKAKPEEIRAQIDEMSQDPVDLSAAADRWRDFRRHYFEEIIEPFERGAVFRVNSKDGTGFYRTLDEDVGLEFLNSFDAAAQIAGIAKTQPRMLQTIRDVTLDDMAAKTVVNGAISPRSLERWMESRRGALSAMPEVEREVMGIARAVAEVEGRFKQGKSFINQRLAAERQQIQGKRQQLGDEVRATLRGGQAQSERTVALSQQVREQAVVRDQQLQQAMQPLLARMGKLNERKMALEDTMLSRRLIGIETGTQEPGAVIDQAVKNPALMDKLIASTAPYPEAKAALKRHVWDGLTALNGKSLAAYMAEHERALTKVLGPEHMKRIGEIRDALQMMEFSPAGDRAQPIKADLMSKFRLATGVNPSAAISSFLGVQRGRSSRNVEGFASAFRWLAVRNEMAMEKAMREALFNPEVARSLLHSANLRRRSGEPTRQMRAWLWRLGLIAPQEGEGESNAQN